MMRRLIWQIVRIDISDHIYVTSFCFVHSIVLIWLQQHEHFNTMKERINILWFRNGLRSGSSPRCRDKDTIIDSSTHALNLDIEVNRHS